MAAGLVAGDSSGSLRLLFDLTEVGDSAKTDERGGLTLLVLDMLQCSATFVLLEIEG